MPPIIEVTNLSRAYGDLMAVDDISFTVETGSLFACVGPNGAGKSTTISVLTTLAPARGGSVSYSISGLGPKLIGHDDALIRSRIGVVFQDSLLDRPLTVKANLEARVRLYGHSQIADLVQALQLDDIMDRSYGTLSGGQRRRVDIARALLTSPEILFLDEPTTGLDPQSRNLVWETIEALRQDHGLTVFLTTHYMEEAERADQVTIIDHGKIIAAGSPADLRLAHTHSRLRLRGRKLLQEQLAQDGIESQPIHNGIEISVESSAQARSIINSYVDRVDDFELVHGTMDDVFLALTGTSLRED